MKPCMCIPWVCHMFPEGVSPTASSRVETGTIFWSTQNSIITFVERSNFTTKYIHNHATYCTDTKYIPIYTTHTTTKCIHNNATYCTDTKYTPIYTTHTTTKCIHNNATYCTDTVYYIPWYNIISQNNRSSEPSGVASEWIAAGKYNVHIHN